MIMINELGGFDEDKEEFDGTKDEWVAFNFCLAEEYFNCMKAEEWGSLGEMSSNLINKIIYWLNYDEKINNDIIEEIKKISIGLFLTNKERTFIDAIVAENKIDLAETFITLGSKDVRLYLLCMFSNESYFEDTVLNQFHMYIKSNYNEFLEFLRDIFDALELEYCRLTDIEEQFKMLNDIKKNIQNIRYPKEYGPIKFQSIGNYKWVKELKKK